MQINTSTLLNMLGSNIGNNVKQKIQDASSGGKTDISAIVKDKTIQTVLSETFKALIQGGKDKSTVLQTLQNSRQIFDIKSFSNDIKTIADTLGKTDNPKLQQQSIILKEFFINIKNIDENTLKTNFANSGVMLESKLKDMASLLKEPVLTNKIGVHKLLQQLGLDIKNILQNGISAPNIQNLKTTMGSLTQTLQGGDLQSNIKTAVSNLLNTINKIPIGESIELPKEQIKGVLSNIKSVEQTLLKDISKNLQLTQLQKETGNISDTLKNISSAGADETIGNIKNSITKLETLSSKGELKPQPANSIKNLINELKALAKAPAGLNRPHTVNSLLNNLQNITQQIQDGFNEPVKAQIQPKLSSLISAAKEFGAINDKGQIVLNNISNLNTPGDKLPLGQKELLALLKQSSAVNKIELQKGVETIVQVLNNISRSGISEMQAQALQNTIATTSSTLAKADLQLEVKTAVNNLLNGSGKIAQNPRVQPQFTALNSLINNANTINDTLLNTPLNLPGQMAPDPLPNITKDIKGVLLHLQEQIDKGDTNLPKELKATVEKTLTQIEYFQALSFSSSSNHTYLPFSWENIEEGDIKFSADSKDNFSCQINLKLKEHGEIKILLELDKKNYLNINMGVGDNSFKSKIQQNLQLLRKGINNINLNLQSLNIFDLNAIGKSAANPYNSGESLNFGLDVKV